MYYRYFSDCKLKMPYMAGCEGETMNKAMGTCLDSDGNEVGVWNSTLFAEKTGRVLVSAASEYWK